jgi:YidC/Oxa1 family membrane protein insertase
MRSRTRKKASALLIMENQRLILFVALSIVILLLWQAWQGDFGKQSRTSPPATETVNAPPAGTAPAQTSETVPAATATATTTASAVPSDKGLAHGERIRVITDLMRAEIDTYGGDLRQVDLPKYPVAKNQPNVPFRLLNDDTAKIFVAQSGLLSATAAPDHHAQYQTAQKEYQLAAGADEVKVPLTWTNDKGITVTKTYIFHRGSYAIDVDFEVANASGQEWRGRQYRQFERARVERESRFIYTFTGAAISNQENKYRKLSFDDMDKEALNKEVKGGWVAMIQHYFVAAWVPGQDETNHLYSKALGDGLYILGLSSSEETVPAGGKGEFKSRLYVGPKLQDHLAAVAPNLELTVDYGLLTFIAKPIFWLMKHIHGIVQNWGWTIILLTLIIKLSFYKLSEASYRSMANMRRMQPKMTQIRERFGDDRQRMSQAMMELYKKEKINPLGGCFPILIQIPVFISLYWVLLESVELRQAPFILWLNDLSSKDPYYVLPLLMGISMFIQQRLSPAPPDPLQAKIMMALPVVFTAFFAFFPSGLVLYWVTNNVLSISQQWYITRRLEKMAAAKG